MFDHLVVAYVLGHHVLRLIAEIGVTGVYSFVAHSPLLFLKKITVYKMAKKQATTESLINRIKARQYVWIFRQI